MTKEEALALLGGSSETPAPATEGTRFEQQLLAQPEPTPSRTQFERKVGQSVALPDFISPIAGAEAEERVSGNAAFIQRNALPGVPIDLNQELSPSLQMRVAALPRDEDRLAFLSSRLRSEYPDFYGADMPARLSDTGEILVRVPDERGRPVEVLVNKPGITGTEINTLAAHAPATAAALVTAIGARRLPLGERFPRAAASVYSSVAAAGTQAIEDVAARAALPGVEAEVGEAVGRRAGEIPTGLAIDAGVIGLHSIGRRLLSPFAAKAPTEIGQQMREGAQYYREQQGKEFPMTVGEITQSPMVLRTEAAMGALPGSSKSMEKIKAEKTKFFEETQEGILGVPRADIPGEEDIGRRAVGAIKGKIQPVKESIKSQKEELFDALSQRLEQSMDEVTGEARQVFTERVGAGVRAKALSKWETFQQQQGQKYEDLYKMPGGSDRILQAPRAAQKAEDALKNLPGYETGAEVQRFETVLPQKAISVLEELANTKGAQMSLRDLIGARSALDDVIAKERGGLPDVKLRELTSARKLFTEAIEEAAGNSPDKAMLPTWKKINEEYAKGAKEFDPNAIQKLFIRSDKPGYVLDEDIVKNLKPSEYMQFKEFLGADSPEFRTLRRSVIDEMMIGARLPGGRIDGNAFLKDYFKLYQGKRAIFDDIFPSAKAKGISSLGEVLRDLPDSIDAQKLADAISGTEGTIRQRLGKLAQTEAALNEKYRSAVLKDIGEGTLDPNSFDAKKFVDLFYANRNVGPEHIQRVMAELSDAPEVQQDLRRKVIDKLFYDAQRLIKSGDPQRTGRGEVLRPANVSALERALGDEENRAKFVAIAGNKTMRDITELSKLLRSSEITEQAFGAMGSISSGMMISGMIRGPLRYADDFLKQKFVGLVETLPVVREYAQNLMIQKTPFRQIFSDDTAMAIIGSVPFQRALVREYGTPAAREMTQNFLRAINRYGEENPQPESPDNRLQRFEQMLGQPR